MTLSLLRVHHLRNLQTIEVEPCPGINVIWGGNGAGKTTVLEAIYLLGRGKSFRGSEVEPIVSIDHNEMLVFGRMAQTGTTARTIGIKKAVKGQTQIRMNNKSVNRLSVLAKNLPLQILTPKTHEILERGSGYRRKFLDWAVFHVEHDYFQLSNRYHRALKQRNAALRKAPNTAFAWDKELIENGEILEVRRKNYISKLTPMFEVTLSRIMGRDDITIKYKRGWPESESYADNIGRRQQDDVKRGYTGTGPHRADIEIEVLGHKVDKVVSRGEQKLVIAALYLAQAMVALEKAELNPILLIDDLPAELDQEKRRLFLMELERLGIQVFITGIEAGYFSSLTNPKMFHVKHGCIQHTDIG
ncbi:DNA recombination and repair protein RecF [hydrothermal vent metagenome]|uniref:DNA replication and repair protein RecF n=1 Tax=hydrothermal vent metagenome TaxID=652676 RepID=A0A3B1AWK4_9ZZZZ